MRPLTQIPRQGVEATLAGLRTESRGQSMETGLSLVSKAKDFGLSMKDYLTLAIDTRQSEKPEQYADLNGYEAALAYLQLPVRDDFSHGVTLDLASDTFQTYPGTRALFPEVFNDMVQWKYRQNANLERVESLIAQSRTISGVEEVTTIVNDDAADYKVARPISEMANIPVKTLRTTEKTVRFYKFGGGIRTSYEFGRRAKLELLTPFMNRMQREVEMGKVGVVTNLLVNGDGVAAAAPSTNQSSYNTVTGSTATNGQISYKHLLAWLLAQYNAGIYIDTVVGNIDAYLQWLLMFAVPTTDKNRTDAENLAAAGFKVGGVPILDGVINFALSTTAPANKLVGFAKAETVEELVEAGSLIQESESAIKNQTITVVKTENSGYKLVHDDTRAVFNYGA